MIIKNHLIDLVYLIWAQVKLIFPFWIIGITAGNLLVVFLKEKLIGLASIINKINNVIIISVFASILGAISPITMHGIIPIIIFLGRSGIPTYAIISFMITSVLINPNLVIFTLALGKDVAIVRLIAVVLAGVLGGICTKYLIKESKILDLSIELDHEEALNNTTVKIKLRKFFVGFRKTVKKTGYNLIIGIILTALFQKYVPTSIMESIFKGTNGLGVLFSASMGVPLYFCGGGTIPLLNALIREGMTLGAAVAFMITGPATKINNLTAVKIVLKGRHFIYYILFIVLYGITAGLIIDWII